jgi:hypothetical protein
MTIKNMLGVNITDAEPPATVIAKTARLFTPEVMLAYLVSEANFGLHCSIINQNLFEITLYT